MGTLGRSLAVIGIGAATLVTALSAVWFARHQGASFYTDGQSIRTPAAGAPVRSILWQPATRVQGEVNTTADEYEPRLSADGTLMVLVRGKPGENADLLESRWTVQGWTAPAPLAGVNSEVDELGPELSRDGSRLYFYSDRDGGLGGYDIWVSTREGDAWGTPLNLGPAVNSAANEYGPALSPDGGTLYFASNRARPGEATPERDPWGATLRETRDRHDYDLYRGAIADGVVQAASPIETLNTPDDEGAPAVSPAGDFLYFASDRAGGTGGFDIYRARLLRGEFQPPENVGDAINTMANDLDPALSMDGFRLHFSSNRAEDGTAEDYGVWVSHSREVFLEYEGARSSLGEYVGFVLPWLLLLLLALLLAMLLMRMWRSPRLAGRFRRLSLLAQCLLVSLALHLLIASLLALWRVKNEIERYLAEQGGTRVVLASAAASDEFSSQLLAEVTSEQTPASVPEASTPVREAAKLEARPVETSAGETQAPSSELAVRAMERAEEGPAMPTPAEAAPPTRAELEMQTPQSEAPRTVAEREQLEAPEAGGVQAPSVATISSPEVMRTDAQESRAEERATITPPAARSVEAPSAAARDSDVAPAPTPSVASAAPTADAPTPVNEARPESPRALVAAAAAPVSPAPIESATAVITPGAGTPIVDGAAPNLTADSPATEAAQASAPAVVGGAAPMTRELIEVQSPRVEASAVATPSEKSNEAPALHARAPMAPPSTAPMDVPTLVRLEVPGSSVREDARIASAVAWTEARAADAASEPRAAVTPPEVGAATRVRAALPSAEAAERTLAREESARETPQVATGAAPSPSGTPALAAARVELAPAASSARDEARARVGVRSGSAEAPSHEPAPAVGTSAAPPLAAGIRVALPLAEEPPAPAETFEQRTPEVRTEVLEKMGGSEETERAVGLALDWLARHQSADGSWSSRGFDRGCDKCGGAAEVDCDGATTGMALLCYLGAGHTPDRDGAYRGVVSKGLEYLLSRQEASGDLRRGETMYSQSIATVALCEAYSMTRDPRLGDAAKRAVEFMCEGVRRAAARRQDERSRSDDTSVLGWQVMAMVSARRSGFEVPDTTFRSAASFLDKVATGRSDGRYAYRPGGQPSAAMTAEAMFVRQLLGAARTERRMEESAAFILESTPRWRDGAPTYFWYYATLALFEQQGEAWAAWNRALVPELLANQRKDAGAAGSWDPVDEYSRLGGRIYQTAVCTLSLEVYYRYRPAGTMPDAARGVNAGASGSSRP